MSKATVIIFSIPFTNETMVIYGVRQPSGNFVVRHSLVIYDSTYQELAPGVPAYMAEKLNDLVEGDLGTFDNIEVFTGNAELRQLFETKSLVQFHSSGMDLAPEKAGAE